MTIVEAKKSLGSESVGLGSQRVIFEARLISGGLSYGRHGAGIPQLYDRGKYLLLPQSAIPTLKTKA